MPRLIVHFDTDGNINYLSDGGQIELLIVDDRAPNDRVYRHRSHHASGGIINKLLGSSRIGELGDSPEIEDEIRQAIDDAKPRPSLN